MASNTKKATADSIIRFRELYEKLKSSGIHVTSTQFEGMGWEQAIEFLESLSKQNLKNQPRGE